MKFAQYLRDTQTPEWKKAYIDYRGLKKRITAIRKAQQGLLFTGSPEDSPGHPATPAATPRSSVSATGDPQPKPTGGRLRRNTVTREPRGSIDAGKSPTIGGRNPSFAKSLSSRLGGSAGRPTNPMAILSLQEVLMQLSPLEIAFFTMLDAELDKVETFYVTREKEALEKGQMLENQLQELVEHRKIFLNAHAKVPWAAALSSALKPTLHKRHLRISRTNSLATPVPGTPQRSSIFPHSPPAMESRVPSSSATTHFEESEKQSHTPVPPPLHEEHEPSHHQGYAADPDNYLYAKRKLKKAVIEHYRGLELLHNYRVLNLTGFRKALKKFEKVTRISVQNQYMKEKIEPSAFSSDQSLRDMIKRMEDMYASTFVKGNKKKAMKRLRGGHLMKSHHFATFRSGLLLGVAIPAIVAGCVEAFKPETQRAIDGWGALMLVYATLFVPTLFVSLVGLNLVVWARSRINYVFIFELETMTALDYREYFEVPNMLLAGLAYCFWLSFSRTGDSMVSPTTWPLIWLGAMAVLVFNPFPIVFHNTRFWLIRVVGKLFLSGTRRVEFTDFWIGDQFCSLVFTLQNFFFIGCIYVDGFSPNWRHQCGLASKYWPAPFVLAILPFVLRLVQSVKRWYDSGLVTHLINGGKYGVGIVSHLLYFLWRNHGTQRSGVLFAFWCSCSTIYAIYGSTWDYLMDWSVLRLHSPNVLLRPELVYASHTSFYYFAIVTNVLLRFSWVIYIPQKGPDMLLRAFIVAILEVLRRWQWNFYRLENEHLGNMDQYRVTREVPLPYLFDDPRREDVDEDDDEERRHLKGS